MNCPSEFQCRLWTNSLRNSNPVFMLCASVFPIEYPRPSVSKMPLSNVAKLAPSLATFSLMPPQSILSNVFFSQSPIEEPKSVKSAFFHISLSLSAQSLNLSSIGTVSNISAGFVPLSLLPLSVEISFSSSNCRVPFFAAFPAFLTPAAKSSVWSFARIHIPLPNNADNS